MIRGSDRRNGARHSQTRNDRLISWLTLLAGAAMCLVAVLLS